MRLASAGIAAVALATVLLPPTAASASEVTCGDPNFVQVTWHPSNGGGALTCFAGRGKNWFRGVQGVSSWMTYLRTGNNDITFVDCNGTTVDYPRGTNKGFPTPPCVAWINIKPF
ncbi:beta/gamma crystallin domain-containing protein [Actinoplanes sp. NBRC 103695]|uniref:beta/gamma crystallin domain-containing protein n=1 Tax=Actinoplanes sp. NBRC 103695 TaxID=3032202 RepID=UPI0033240199